MNKIFIRKEIKTIHFLAFITGKIFIIISIFLMFTDLAFPWSYPLLFLGALLLLPGLFKLFKKEKVTENKLKKKLKK